MNHKSLKVCTDCCYFYRNMYRRTVILASSVDMTPHLLPAELKFYDHNQQDEPKF